MFAFQPLFAVILSHTGAFMKLPILYLRGLNVANLDSDEQPRHLERCRDLLAQQQHVTALVAGPRLASPLRTALRIFTRKAVYRQRRMRPARRAGRAVRLSGACGKWIVRVGVRGCHAAVYVQAAPRAPSCNSAKRTWRPFSKNS